jgi:hypothetical protein
MREEEQMRDFQQKSFKAWAIVMASAVVLACSAERVTLPESGLPCCGPELPIGGSGGTGDTTVQTNDQALVGSWTRLLLFTDIDGTQRGSRLTYQFASDSSFTRTLVSSNFTQGLEDTVVESGRWITQSGTLVLRNNIGLPTETTTRVLYRTARRSDGNLILLLDDAGFVRD